MDHIRAYMAHISPYVAHMAHIWPYTYMAHIWSYMVIYGPYMTIYGPYMNMAIDINFLVAFFFDQFLNLLGLVWGALALSWPPMAPVQPRRPTESRPRSGQQKSTKTS